MHSRTRLVLEKGMSRVSTNEKTKQSPKCLRLPVSMTTSNTRCVDLSRTPGTPALSVQIFQDIKPRKSMHSAVVQTSSSARNPPAQSIFRTNVRMKKYRTLTVTSANMRAFPVAVCDRVQTDQMARAGERSVGDVISVEQGWFNVPIFARTRPPGISTTSRW